MGFVCSCQISCVLCGNFSSGLLFCVFCSENVAYLCFGKTITKTIWKNKNLYLPNHLSDFQLTCYVPDDEKHLLLLLIKSKAAYQSVIVFIL